MYSVGSLLPVEGIEPGSTLLVVGPPMTGKPDLVLQLLAQGFDTEEGAAVISTDASATESATRLRRTPVDQVRGSTSQASGWN